MGGLFGAALLAVNGLTPAPAFADNGASLQDLWPLFDLAVLGGLGLPFLVWMAKRYPPPPEKPLWQPPPYDDYMKNMIEREHWRYSPETKQWTRPADAKPDTSSGPKRGGT